MKIVCVAGGSYKSFYINHLAKTTRCDLLIFNYGIIYDYVTCDEILGNALVTKELMYLAKRLNTVVVAGAYVVEKNEKRKSIILCDKDKIHIIPVSTGAKLNVCNKQFIIGDANTNYRNCNRIILNDKKIIPNINHCVQYRIYIFFDKFGVGVVQNKKYHRKFYKYSKIILK